MHRSYLKQKEAINGWISFVTEKIGGFTDLCYNTKEVTER